VGLKFSALVRVWLKFTHTFSLTVHTTLFCITDMSCICWDQNVSIKVMFEIGITDTIV